MQSLRQCFWIAAPRPAKRLFRDAPLLMYPDTNDHRAPERHVAPTGCVGSPERKRQPTANEPPSQPVDQRRREVQAEGNPVGRLAPNPPGSELRPRVRVRSNLSNERLNGGDILGDVLTVTAGHPPSDICAISTDEDVTTHVGVVDRC
jgi:hypothetical protein